MTTGSAEHDRLITDTHRELTRYARSRGLQPADAEDAAQEATCRAFEHRQGFVGHERPRAWLYRVTSNLMADQRRRRPHAPLSTVLDLPASGPDPSVRAERREQADIALRALANINPRYAQVFWDHDVEGVPAAKLALEMGVSPGAFRQLLHRARAAVRSEHERLGGSACALGLLVPAMRRLSRWREWTMAALAPGLALGALLPAPPVIELPPRPPTASLGPTTSEALGGHGRYARDEGQGDRVIVQDQAAVSARRAPGRPPGRKMTEIVCTPGGEDGLFRQSCLRSGPPNPAYHYVVVRTPLNGRRCPSGQQETCDYQPAVGTSGDDFDAICENLPSQPVAYCTYGDRGQPPPPRKETPPA